MAIFVITLLLTYSSFCGGGFAAFPESVNDTTLVFPGLLHREELSGGNPLPTYAAMLELEEEYLKSPVFASIYPEVKSNFEQFLGVPGSGQRAMSLPALKRTEYKEDISALAGFKSRRALTEIVKRAASTQIVVWGEEHHLPQTRSLYEALIEALWEEGYRYLAAETFTQAFANEPDNLPDYNSGYYLRDPIFAHAVRVAREMGYKLIAYDTSETGEPGDLSFRDRTQANNIFDAVFASEPQAKVLVLAGRGHASEVVASDDWTPMAYVLKQLTGIDPLTIYAPTMSERLTPEEEHPLYRYAMSRGLVSEPTIFVHEESLQMFGSSSFDAYVFWPREELKWGRPDWMGTTMRRTSTEVPKSLNSDGLYLIQAFYLGDPPSVIPVDQIAIDGKMETPRLMLPAGSYWIRSIDRHGSEIATTRLTVY